MILVFLVADNRKSSPFYAIFSQRIPDDPSEAIRRRPPSTTSGG
ncbi:Uncharacterized protein APZ42_026841 [Daphnia magna]|uniref:Uncharacterized protein n=1 Tax=Daphnia magna TaxID=35525 RepID=A0A164RYH7_9CRUS|nr:Uncharacterized protein APZ42_026841 [Daphnia magna]